MIGDIYSTTVNINGSRVFSSRISVGNCCCGGYMNSCFGFGFGNFQSGLGMGLGYGLGLGLVPMMPAIVKGVGSGLCWTGKTIAKGASAVCKGVSKVWNNIFHKKNKTETTKTK